MSNVLLVCRQNEITKALTEIMRGMDFSMIDAVPSGSEGRRRLQEIEYDMVIINTPLGDEFGIELALDTIEKYLIGVVLIVKNELADQVEAKLMDTTAFVISKPINRQLLTQNIKFVLNSKAKMQRLKEQNEKLQKKMDDIKIIYRAKLCLMGYLDMTEEQAHRYIQKQAMDMRISPRQVAENLIRTYER